METIPLSEIHDNMLSWTAELQVIEASHIKTTCAKQMPVRFRRFLLSDPQGIKVITLVTDNNLPKVDGMLLPFKKYYVSKALVRRIPDPTVVETYKFYWTITENTVIEEVDENEYPTLPIYYGFENFKYLYRIADSDGDASIMGIIVHASEPREISCNGYPSIARDYIIVNTAKMPIILTLWNEFEATEGSLICDNIAASPLIVAIRIKVVTDNYLSLTTQQSSVIMVSPHLNEATRLRCWYQDNLHEIAQMVLQSAHTNPKILLPPVKDTCIRHISTIISATRLDFGTVWVKGQVRMKDSYRRMWYLACPYCYEPNRFALTSGIMCNACGEEVYPFPRATITLTIEDSTGYVHITATGEEAEKLIGFDAFRLRQAENEGVLYNDQVQASLNKRKLLCYLKHSSDQVRANTFAKYTIVTSYFAQD